MINANNRPQIHVPIASAASKKFPVLFAHKKMIVKAAKFMTVGAIAASGSAYSTQNLQKSTGSGAAPADISGNVAVDTQLGVAAYGQMSLDVSPEIVLEKGESLYLNHVLTGSLTLDGWLDLDVEIVGN